MTLDGDADTSKGDYAVRYNFGWGTYSGGKYDSSQYLNSVTIIDSDMGGYSSTTSFNRYNSSFNNKDMFYTAWVDGFVIQRTDQTKIASSGQALKFSLRGFNKNLEGYNSSGTKVRDAYWNNQHIYAAFLTVYDKNNQPYDVASFTQDEINKYITISGNTINIGAECSSIPVDAYKVQIMVVHNPATSWTGNAGDTSLSATSWGNAQSLKLKWGFNSDSAVVFNTDDNTAGLLSSIIAFVKDILDGVTKIFGKLGDFMTAMGGWFSDLISSIGGFFSDLFGYILELPGKVWNVFETGLKKLFVPSEDYISGFVDDFKEILSDRFGFLYETGELISDAWERISDTGSDGQVTIPKTTVDLAGTDFSFGGWTVDVVPNKFEFLLTIIKALTSAFATVLFINGMKNRFTRLMEGNE